MIRQLIAPLAVAIVTFHAGQVLAQGAFPAPLPGKAEIVELKDRGGAKLKQRDREFAGRVSLNGASALSPPISTFEAFAQQ